MSSSLAQALRALCCRRGLSRCGIKTRIVDKRGTKVFNGQADGLHCRTLEIFDSFGFAHRASRELNYMIEICLWNPDENGRIRRSDRFPDTIPQISRFQQVVLHQGRIERFFLNSMKEHGNLTVERGVLPVSFVIDEAKAADFDNYPISQHQKSADGQRAVVDYGLSRSNLVADDTDDLIMAATADSSRDGQVDLVKAKFLVGCDGAHSWVRHQAGFKMEGDSTDYIWRTLDIVTIIDFPDIRHLCAIHSANAGTIMVIPRENKLVRLYIQLQATSCNTNGEKAD
ncbi:FAD-binding monooxygenase [Aspergillus foveolatus]|uniref:FAD-binding monooxygenase n=1 Tax=Aspergillus foveolatus TaxID=210207 RepID=UPI003CCD967F